VQVFYYLVLVSWMAKERNRNLVAIKLGETLQQQLGRERHLGGLEESKRISILSM